MTGGAVPASPVAGAPSRASRRGVVAAGSRWLLALLAATRAPHALALAQSVTGVGSSFPRELYLRWARIYARDRGVSIDYTALGTSAGIRRITSGEADFAASNRPLPDRQLQEAGLLQFPVIMGGTVPVVNLPGIAPGELRLSGEALADILLGRITRWNDPDLRRLNPATRLPSAPIAVARRGDPSGTTYLLSDYLTKVSPRWSGMVAAEGGLPANWKTGHTAVGTQGLEELFLRLPNSITYFDYAYAKRRRFAHVRLRNRAGEFVTPELGSLQSAALSTRWVGTMGHVTTDAAHPAAWPVASPSYVLVRRVHRNADQAANALQALAFFEWACAHGDQIADDMDFVPLPGTVKDEVQAAIALLLEDTPSPRR